MTSDEIRASFLEYFRKHGHTIVPSASLIPAGDPTLLFTNAGMNQFKDVFLGIGQREYTRAVDTQKCLRVSGKHNDLEEVGYSPSHHTFFEMLGNWSFGDYYKQEAIAFAWELVIELWQIPKERLWATVYLEDDEAEKLWLQETDLPLSRIRRCDKDNFWEMGETGPCGPCSELFVDMGVEAYPETANDPDAGPNTSDRFREFWNLVFIQYNRNEEGTLEPLPATHVDTGMGFERITSILQGVDTNYKTDLFTPLLATIADMTDTAYFDDERGLPHRVIADHIRCLTFAIGDGVMPSNEGRGYVIRRILRRAVLYGKKLEMNEAFIYRLVDNVVELLGDVFPDVLPRREFITRTIQGEEHRFHQTIERGLELLDHSFDTLKAQNGTQIDGKRAFELYDTFGFPLDLTEMLARERGFTVDDVGFEQSMEAQRSRGRAAWEAKGGAKDEEISVYAEVLKEHGETEFVGYTQDNIDAEIVALIANAESIGSAQQGDEVFVLMNRTPFYGESGGQVGDVGTLENGNARLAVEDTLKPSADLVVHKCKVLEGEITPYTEVQAQINTERRNAVAVSHTATHLLHSGLRQILGTHVAQAGSLVEAGRLRFDFSHYESVSPEQLRDIEEFVNEKIRENDALSISEMSLDDAKSKGALAFFGDKYGDIVRVVQAGTYSVELCGGTHVDATGELGFVKLMSESSIAAGVRRDVEALTGTTAVATVQEDTALLANVANLLKTPKAALPERIERLLQEQRDLEQQLQQLKSQHALSSVGTLAESATLVEDVRVVSSLVADTDRNGLRRIVDELKTRLESGVVALAAVSGNEVAFVVGVTADLVKTVVCMRVKSSPNSPNWQMVAVGGRPELAQGGGKGSEQSGRSNCEDQRDCWTTT